MQQEGEGETAARQQWSSHTEFVLSCLSCSAGLANIWRFPTTTFENGGGAFLLPYFIVFFTVTRVSDPTPSFATFLQSLILKFR